MAECQRSPFKSQAAHFALLFLLLIYLPCLNAQESQINWSLEFAADTVQYQEFDEKGDRLNKESNVIPHGNVRLQKPLTASTILEIKAGLSHGYVTYQGELQNGSPYNTTSRMTLKQGAMQIVWSMSDTYRLWLGLGEMRWDRHILAKGNVRTLNEYYDWQRAIAGVGYRLHQHDIQVSVERLVNAGLDLDLQSQGNGFIRVQMPDGFQLGMRYEYLTQGDWYLFMGTSYRYFDRGPMAILGKNGYTEPENHFAQFKLGVGYSF